MPVKIWRINVGEEIFGKYFIVRFSAFVLVSLRFGYLLYLALVIEVTTAAMVAREGSESARRATELRRGSPEGAGERKRERRRTGGLIQGWWRRRCWSWRWVAMALAVRDANGRFTGSPGSLDHTRRMTSLSGVTRIRGISEDEEDAEHCSRNDTLDLRAINHDSK